MPNSSPPTSFTECTIWPRSDGSLKGRKTFPDTLLISATWINKACHRL